MISLKAFNQNLTAGMKYSYLLNNCNSGVGSIVVINSDGFSTDDYILLGEWGSETSEIIKLSGVTAATHTLSLASNTKFSHSESTKIIILKYNQVKFYQTAAAVFSSTENPLGTIDVQPDSLYTIYQDVTNVTGFGWFVFYNETTAKATSASNAIPYGGFDDNSVKRMLDKFFSLLNSKERKLISDADALSYLDEGYSEAKSELNLVNDEYNVSDEYDFSIVSGTSEYSLPDNFSSVLSFYNGTDKKDIGFIKLASVPNWDSESSNVIKYYLRGNYLGISPEPTVDITYTMRYKTKSAVLSSYYTNISLPDNKHLSLIDFMMFRASLKLKNGEGADYYKLFENSIQKMKIGSHRRSNDIDSWGIESSSNV